ncbi:hypothetical protein NMG60_11019147 [Bertholletia excelsa]
MGKYQQRAGSLPPLNLRSCSMINGELKAEDHGYTSLRDMMLISPSILTPSNEGASFDSSSISIRNELVKHAASMYVQSAAVLVNRNQNFFVRVWENFKAKFLFGSSSETCIGKPLRACFEPIFQCLDYIVNGVARAWHHRIA